MIDYETGNLSFIKMAHLYKEMGIRNYDFILELNDPSLSGIDPRDEENLTRDQKIRIYLECTKNVWYYLREVVRIPTGGGLVPFTVHRGNIAMIWAALKNISTFAVWPRQSFKTTSVCGLYSWMTYFGSRHNKISLVAYSLDIAIKNLAGVKEFRDNLPSYLHLHDEKTDIDNMKEVYVRGLDNKIVTRGGTMNPDSAKKAGRGLSTPIQWYDEISFIRFISDMYDSMVFAYSTVAKIAEENQSFHHRIMTTSAGFLDSEEGKWSYRFLQGACDFTENMYDMDDETLKSIIKSSSVTGFLDISFMYYDLGKDDNYIDEQKRLVANSDDPETTLAREVLNQWKSASSDHPLGTKRLEMLMNQIKDPSEQILINDTYLMKIYVDLNEFDINKPLIGGLDLGGNLKEDFSVLAIMDPTDFNVVATLRSNSQSSTLFSVAIVTIMRELFPNLILVPERNFNAAIIDNICTLLPDSRRRVYHEKDDDDRPGIFNTKKVREVLYNDVLRVAVDNYAHLMNDKHIITEINGLTRTRTGRIDHKQGEHDDTLIAYLYCLYFLLHVTDNGKYIDKSLILSKLAEEDVEKKDELEHKKKIRELRNENRFFLDGVEALQDNIDSIADKFYDYKQDQIKEGNISLVRGDTDELDEVAGSDDMDEFKKRVGQMNEKGETVQVMNLEVTNKGYEDFRQVFGNHFNVF